MLRFLSDIEGLNVIDVRTNRVVGTVVDVIVNPHNLSIAALVCYSRREANNLYLQTQDIFEFKGNSFVVQSDDVLSSLDELVRLQELIEINYRPVGKPVKTSGKKRVGVVEGIAFDDKSFMFEKIYVRPPVTKFLKTSGLVIGRNQVVEVTDKVLIVKDSEIRSGKKVAFGAET